MRKLIPIFVAATLLAFGTNASAGLIDFVSNPSDGCKVITSGTQTNCTGVTSEAYGDWITEAAFNSAAGSTGAEWIQAEGSYIHSNLNDYRIFEIDLNKTGHEVEITSLWLSVDDDVEIKVGGVSIWNSNALVSPWTQAIDVIASLGSTISVGGNQRLNFYVHDIGNANQGPTGLIFAGTATTMVPEPSSLALLMLGLVGLAIARKSRTV